jgi:hypothetical protein
MTRRRDVEQGLSAFDGKFNFDINLGTAAFGEISMEGWCRRCFRAKFLYEARKKTQFVSMTTINCLMLLGK